MTVQTYNAGEHDDGKRLDTFIAERAEITRSASAKLIEGGRVSVDGEFRDKSFSVYPGCLIEIAMPDPEPIDAQPEDIPIEVIYEDEAVTVVNKPAGMPTILSHGHYEDTLANALAYRYRGRGFVMRAVNRLDRDTSGICLVANSRRSAYILCEQMKSREMTKKYIALLDGRIDADNSEKIIITERDGLLQIKSKQNITGTMISLINIIPNKTYILTSTSSMFINFPSSITSNSI